MNSENSDSNRIFSLFKKSFSNVIFRLRGAINTESKDDCFDLTTCNDLETSKQEMIKGVLRLSTRNARDIMIPRIDLVALEAKTKLKDVIETISEAGHSRIPVFENTIDNIIGILYAKDLLQLILDKPRKFHLKKILHEPYFVPETIPLDDLLVEFKKRKLHLAIAFDEYGGIGGIVTLEDVLEEIVGDISDEFDDQKLPEILSVSKNIYEIDSRISIIDLNEELGLNLPLDEFDTLGGFVFDIFGAIPKKNETARYKNISFKIKDIKGTRINRIILTILKK